MPSTPDDAHILTNLGTYLRCDYLHNETLRDAERARCVQALATLRNTPQPIYVPTKEQVALRTKWETDLRERTPPPALAAAGPRFVVGCSWDNGLCVPDESEQLGCADPGKKSLTGVGQDIALTENLTFSVGLMMDTTGCFGLFKIGLTYRW